LRVELIVAKRAFGPFKKGDPDAKRAGRKGGKVSVAAKASKKLSEEQRTLEALQPLGVLDFMDRFGLTGESWAVWRIVAKVLDGTELTPGELTLYTELTGRTTVPKNLRTLWAILGRRAGKSHFSSVVAVHAATRRYTKLATGEKARVLLLARDQDQSGVLFDYIDGMFSADAELSRLVVSKTRKTLQLANRVLVQVTTSNFRTVRRGESRQRSTEGAASDAGHAQRPAAVRHDAVCTTGRSVGRVPALSRTR
jgi:hypothetical protein